LILRLHDIGIAVAEIAEATADHRVRLGCELEGGQVHDPAPAVAFGGQRTAWLIGPDHVLTELVEGNGPVEKGG
jgi:hypothetical protein